MADALGEVGRALFKGFSIGWKATEQATLVAHWHKPFDGLHVSAKQFYADLEAALLRRQVPQTHFSRVAWKETGLLSANREYLRLEWRRYVYDICTAPMGTGCFFSSWLVIVPPKLTVWHMAGMAASVVILFLLFMKIGGVILFLIGLVFLARLLRGGKLRVEPRAEEFLAGLTILIPIIDVFFRRATYFELDTAEMFQGLVHTALLEVIDGITQANNIERLGELERKPVMRDFFARR